MQPAATVAGRLGSVDRHLIETERLALIRKREDFASIRVEKKTVRKTGFEFRLRPLLIEKCLEMAYDRRR